MLKADAYIKNDTLDKSFRGFLSEILEQDVSHFLNIAIENANHFRLSDPINFEKFSLASEEWFGIKNFLLEDKNFVAYYGSWYSYIKENISDFKWLYESLCDNRSKLTLYNILSARLKIFPLPSMSSAERVFEQYFDLDIVSCDENEVFVDCGACTGDSVISFIKNYGKYKRIYSYELMKDSFSKVQKTTKDMPNVVLRNFGVSDKEEEVTVFSNGGGSTIMKNAPKNHPRIVLGSTVTLDEDIKEPVTFIKMDVEGSEAAALIGAKNHIQNEKPKLAICLYHKTNDILELPKLIKKLNPNYHFYLRQHPLSINVFPQEYYIIAI